MRTSSLAAAIPAADAAPPSRRGDWPRIVIAAVLILFAGLAVTWTLGRIRQQLKQQIGESLKTVVATARGGISLWVDRIEEEISVLAATPEVVDAVREQLAAQSTVGTASTSKRDLTRTLRPILDKYEYTGFALFVPNGARITGSGELEASPVNGSDETVQAALRGDVGVHLSIEPERGERATLIVAAPVRDPAGRIIAALALSLDPAGRLTAAIRLARPGATGETYVFDRSGRLLTGSRFAGDFRAPPPPHYPGMAGSPGLPALSPSLRIRDSAPLISRLDRNGWPIEVDVDGHTDYRGIDVLGAWTWARKLDVGIATEVDRDEAMKPWRTIRTLTLLMLAAIGVSLLVLLSLLASRGRMRARQYAFERAAEARRETLAMVSHDLRSPLNNIMLCAGMISATAEPNALGHVRSVIERAGRRMQKLIVDLLDISEMEGGRLKIERKPSDARTLIDEVRDAFAEEAGAKNIDMAVDCPRHTPPVLADHDRIVQVLTNLVGNALKFTPPGGKIALCATAAATEVRFEVRDTGPGIAEDQLAHIFQQFWTTAGSERVGRGLGLFIAKSLVEHHRGRIWVETVRDRGTSFFFTIPRAEPEAG